MNENRGPLETTIALMADHMQPFALEAPVEVAPLDNPSPNRFRRVYRATSGVLTADYAALLDGAMGSQEWSKEQWAHYTEAPPDARYTELASEIVSRLPDDLRANGIARAFAITSWLSKKGIYSLKNEHSGAEDPTASFLFGDLTGYCVHFSHAAAYLMRSVGVPARVATGYAVSESARQGGSALLLSGAASHAWPEVFIDGFGWVVLDVYPERALDPPEQPMDADLQRLLGELARGASPIPLSATDIPRLKELARRVTFTVGAWLLAMVIGVLLVLYAVKVWRRVAPSFASAPSLPRLVYRAELDRLGEVSIRRTPGESREAFAYRLRDHLPSFEGLTSAHVSAAFGVGTPDPGTLRQQAAGVRRDVRGGFPLWKRFLGLITPWSWLRSK
jgi:transglutaminase-like putative cysteine protease